MKFFKILVALLLTSTPITGYSLDALNIDNANPVIVIPDNDQTYEPYAVGFDAAYPFESIRFKTRKEIRPELVDYISMRYGVLQKMGDDISDAELQHDLVKIIIDLIKGAITIDGLMDPKLLAKANEAEYINALTGAVWGHLKNTGLVSTTTVSDSNFVSNVVIWTIDAAIATLGNLNHINDIPAGPTFWIGIASDIAGIVNDFGYSWKFATMREEANSTSIALEYLTQITCGVTGAINSSPPIYNEDNCNPIDYESLLYGHFSSIFSTSLNPKVSHIVKNDGDYLQWTTDILFDPYVSNHNLLGSTFNMKEFYSDTDWGAFIYG